MVGRVVGLNETGGGDAEHTVAQTSASWLSGGLFQRQIVPRAAPSFGQPGPISRLGRAGQPYGPTFPLKGAPPYASNPYPVSMTGVPPIRGPKAGEIVEKRMRLTWLGLGLGVGGRGRLRVRVGVG